MIDINVIIGVSIALVGAVLLNVGKGLEKMKVHVFTQGWGMFKQPHIKDLGVWGLGLLMTFSFGVSQWIAMRFVDNPSLVTAMNGFGLIALVLFAVRVIGEHVTARELAGIAVIIVFTFVMTYFQKETANVTSYNFKAFILGMLIPLATFGGLCAYAWKTRKLHGFAWGGLSGTINSMPSMLLKISWIVVGTEASIFQQLKYPYLYLAMILGIATTATSQVGFLRDRAIIVVPTFISFNMIVPAALEYFVFGVSLEPIQYLSMVGIIFGVIFLSISTPDKALALEIDKEQKDGD